MCCALKYVEITVTERSLIDHFYLPIQINTTIDGQVISPGELVAKEQYLCSKK